MLRDIVFGDRRYFRELQAGSEGGSPQIFSPTDSSDSSSWDCSPARTPEAGQRVRYSLTEPPTHVRAARQLGISPPAHQLRAARSRRAARTRQPRALARVHGRASPLEPWLQIPRAITERSRAPERDLPRCYQLLVAARQSTISKGADGRRPSCLTCEPFARQSGARTRQQTGLDILNFRSSPWSVVDWVDVDEDAWAKR